MYLFSFTVVSLENVLLDVKELQRGMDLTRREYSMHGHNTMLKDFIHLNESKLKKLQDDAKIAQVLIIIIIIYPEGFFFLNVIIVSKTDGVCCVAYSFQ